MSVDPHNPPIDTQLPPAPYGLKQLREQQNLTEIENSWIGKAINEKVFTAASFAKEYGFRNRRVLSKWAAAVLCKGAPSIFTPEDKLKIRQLANTGKYRVSDDSANKVAQ